MDKLDLKILAVLDWNARTPVKAIARAIGANKYVVAYRIKKLEETGIIKRYFPVLDMSKLGYHTSRLYFDLEEMDEHQERAFISFLDKEIRAGLIFRMAYPYRYGIFLWTKSIYDVGKAIIQIKRKLDKTLLRYHHSLICTLRQYPKDYLFGKRIHESSRSLEPVFPISYDDVDFKILQEFAKNTRLSTVHIAKNIHVPQTTVSHKIKNLEKKKIILGYRAELDFIKLGFMNFFLEIYLENNASLAQIEAWANTHPNVVWLQKIIGACDIEIEVEVKDRIALEELLNELRKKFKSIRKIVFWSQDYKKLTFVP